MADSFSNNLNITKPEVGASSSTWGAKQNAGVDIVDSVFNPAGNGFPIGINVPAATTATTYIANIGGILTGTGTVNFLGMTTVAVSDATFEIASAADSTRIVRISLAAISTGATRTLSPIDADMTLVGATNTQTLTNKTLSSPAINTATLSVATTGIQFLGTTTGTMSLLAAATATGAVVMPSGLTLDTMAVLTAAQTFLNKTLTDAIVNTQTPGNNTTKAASTAYVDAAVTAARVATPVVATYATNANLATATPADDTIPQIGEGNDIFGGVSFTALTSTHRIKFTVSGAAASGVGADTVCVALFIDGGTSAISSKFFTVFGSGTPTDFNFLYEAVQSSGAHTYNIRMGANSGGLRLNGTGAARLGGGTQSAVFTIEEVPAP